MNKINLTINGIAVQANPGQTILEAARDNMVIIPTLCHDDRLKPFGSCLLCRVEVEGARGNMLACGTTITEGMIVRTETEGVNESRKACVELLLSQHYGDCVAPCSQTCPAGVDIQGYIAHIANGEYQEAVKLIKEKNPLPLVCGRICTRPCEDECRRNIVDDKVGIDYLKRFAADFDINSENPYIPTKKADTGKKAAVIGAGPAGLSAAFYLALEGHAVTIFERWPEVGGMLRYGIPEYRLPKAALDAEVELIKKLGVEIKFNVNFGVDETPETLKAKGYEAIFLGVGSQLGTSMGCEGESCSLNVLSGVDFLGQIGLNKGRDLTGKTVIVVGGGNTAIDASRSALRLGADEVRVAYRRTRAEMPAHEMEIEEAEFEGVIFDYLIAPQKITTNEDGKVGIQFIKMELGAPDASGRRKPMPVAGSEYTQYVDYVIAAIGQTQDLSFINEEFNIATSANKIVADKQVCTTNVDGIFAGGDVVTGPQTAIAAIGAGKKAAMAMSKYLKGQKVVPMLIPYNHTKGTLESIDRAPFEQFEKMIKEKMPMLDQEARNKNFKEVELGFTEEQAIAEAKRCLSCGCKDVFECKLRAYATTYKAEQDHFAGELKIHPIDDSHPFLVRDQNKCIMCGRCVRICHDVQGAGAIGFIARGYNTVISPSFGQPFGEESKCESCGQCVSSCPVGALTEKAKLNQPGPFFEKQVDTICNYCGTGCSITVSTAGKTYVRTTSKVGAGVNNGNLCKKGRFGNDFLNDASRLVTPMVKKDGKLVETTWAEAYETIKVGMTKDAAIYASTRMTNEEYKKLADLGKKAFGTNKLASFGASVASAGLKNTIGFAGSTATYEDIKTADVIVTLGFDIKEANPVVALAVKEAAEKGAKLNIVCYDKTSLDAYATKKYKLEAEKLQLFTDEIYAVLQGEEKSPWSNELAATLKAAKKPLFIVADNVCHAAVSSVANIAIALNKVVDGILFMHGKANAQGQIDNFLSEVKCGCCCDNKAESLLIYGEDPVGCEVENAKAIMEAAKFVVVSDLFLTETAQMADVVLPFASALETDGTYTNSECRVQKLNKAIASPFGKTNKNVISELAEVFGVELGCACADKAELGVNTKEINAKVVQEEGCGCNKKGNLYADILEARIK